jgi:hypothetical protein
VQAVDHDPDDLGLATLGGGWCRRLGSLQRSEGCRTTEHGQSSCDPNRSRESHQSSSAGS